jgi:hypothetical protein
MRYMRKSGTREIFPYNSLTMSVRNDMVECDKDGNDIGEETDNAFPIPVPIEEVVETPIPSEEAPLEHSAAIATPKKKARK